MLIFLILLIVLIVFVERKKRKSTMRAIAPNRMFYLVKKKKITNTVIFKRNYSLITSVNINNWDSIHKEILQKIKSCDFVSVDVEYTGLHLKDERYVSIDASYEAHCYGAKSFFPCQIGLTVAKKIDLYTEDNTTYIKENEENRKKNTWNNENEEKEKKKNYHRWEISPYSIYIFPKENKNFSVSTTTLIFLRENNFDFNEWIFKGVSYLTPSEENEKKKFLLEKKEQLHSLLSRCEAKNEKPEQQIIDIKKIIHDIQNNKIVDEEDKEPIVDIIKKIDVWFHQTNSTNNCCDKKNYNTNERYSKINDQNSTGKTKTRNDYNIEDLQNLHTTENVPEEERHKKERKKKTEEHIFFSEAEKRVHQKNNQEESEELTFEVDEANNRKEKKEGEKQSNDENLPLYIEIENPYLRLLAHTLITKYFHSLFCISVKVNEKKHLALYKTEKDTYKEQIKVVETEIEKINKTIGIRLLFDEIIKKKKILIGHNCFYDILHIYQTFYGELPKMINEFKEKWTNLFHYTFDTKYMNETNEHLQVLNGPATLKGLCEYMGSLIAAKENERDFFFHLEKGKANLPQCFHSFIHKSSFEKTVDTAKNDMKANEEKDEEHNNENGKKYYDEVFFQGDEHNAGYDSLLTCFLFIFQCHHILKKNNLRWSDVQFHRNDMSKMKEINEMNEQDKFPKTYFFDLFSNMVNKIKLVKTQPNVISLTSNEHAEMDRHFYMYDYPRYFKKWEIMKIWSPLWVSLSKVDEQSCWVIAKSEEDAKHIKMIYNMMQNPSFKLCTYAEYLEKFKNN